MRALPGVLLVGLVLLGGVLHSAWPTAVALAVTFGAAGAVLAVIRPEVPDPFEYGSRAARGLARAVAGGIAIVMVAGFVLVAVVQDRPDAYVDGVLGGLVWAGLPAIVLLTLVTHLRRTRLPVIGGSGPDASWTACGGRSS